MKQKLEFKIEDGKLLSTVRPKDVRTSSGNCYFCHEPVLVSSGQLTKFLNEYPTHKSCRKRG